MLVSARRRVTRRGRGSTGFSRETVGVTTPTSCRKKNSRCSPSQVTSIIQAKKFILVVRRLLCFLRSLSDSLIPCVISLFLPCFKLDTLPCVVMVCFFRNLKMAPYRQGTMMTNKEPTMFGRRRVGTQTGPWNSTP